jgi:hypothetical protein
LRDQSASTCKITVAPGVFAAGHLGELTQVIDVALVDAVAAETGTVQRRVRLLPTRVVIFFVLALALFERCAYRQVWAKMIAGLGGLAVVPSAGALSRARRRVGAKPLRALFEAVCGPVGRPGTPGAFWRGLRTVALDGACVHVRDTAAIAARYPKIRAAQIAYGYPLLRLTALIECGTRALIGAVFGPESHTEHDHARALLGRLRAGMLLLADAGYDDWTLMREVRATGAHYLFRSTAARTPLIMAELADGSYLSVLGYGKLPVRIVEAWITVTWADGTTHRQQWRLISSLLDHVAYPAAELVTLYHQRWQIETAYASIKCTILDGRVLRSAHPEDIDQEVYALLCVYQAIIRITVDAIDSRPATHPQRASFTIAIQTARDQVITANAITPDTNNILIGAIGTAVLANLLPTRRPRAKARTRKHATSKYARNAGQFPPTAQRYTLHTEVKIMETGLTARSKT